MKNKKRLKRIIFSIIAFVALCAAVFFVAQIYVDNSAKQFIVSLDNVPEVDVILVLGARVYENGQPSHALADRLNYAYELYKSGKAEKILVSGDHGSEEYDEVNTMKQYLMDKGVPRKNILLDHAGFDTFDSIYRAKEIFQVKSMVISTQNFHIKRAIYIARRIGIEAYGYPSPDRESYNMGWFNLRESIAKVKAVWDTDIVSAKPTYGGTPIPCWSDGTVTDG